MVLRVTAFFDVRVTHANSKCNQGKATSTLFGNTKQNFSWKSDKMNVKFHKNCDYIGKILKISCVRRNFVKFDIHFLGFP